MSTNNIPPEDFDEIGENDRTSINGTFSVDDIPDDSEVGETNWTTDEQSTQKIRVVRYTIDDLEHLMDDDFHDSCGEKISRMFSENTTLLTDINELIGNYANGITYFYKACMTGRFIFAETLLDYDADPRIIPVGWKTPMYYLARGREYYGNDQVGNEKVRKNIIRKLFSKDHESISITEETRGKYYWVAQLAFKEGMFKIAHYIVYMEEESIIKEYYRFALFCCIERNWESLFAKLLNIGVDPGCCVEINEYNSEIDRFSFPKTNSEAETEYSRTPLLYAIECGRKDMAVMLYDNKYGRKLGGQLNLGKVIQRVHSHHCEEVIEFLLNLVTNDQTLGVKIMSAAVRTGCSRMVMSFVDQIKSFIEINDDFIASFFDIFNKYEDIRESDFIRVIEPKTYQPSGYCHHDHISDFFKAIEPIAFQWSGSHRDHKHDSDDILERQQFSDESDDDDTVGLGLELHKCKYGFNHVSDYGDTLKIILEHFLQSSTSNERETAFKRSDIKAYVKLLEQGHKELFLKLTHLEFYRRFCFSEIYFDRSLVVPPEENQFNPLSVAAMFGEMEIVQHLISNGAQINLSGVEIHNSHSVLLNCVILALQHGRTYKSDMDECFLRENEKDCSYYRSHYECYLKIDVDYLSVIALLIQTYAADLNQLYFFITVDNNSGNTHTQRHNSTILDLVIYEYLLKSRTYDFELKTYFDLLKLIVNSCSTFDLHNLVGNRDSLTDSNKSIELKNFILTSEYEYTEYSVLVYLFRAGATKKYLKWANTRMPGYLSVDVNFNLCQVLVLEGLTASTEEIQDLEIKGDSYRDFVQWYYKTKETPLSLRCMCRTQIRKTLIECHSIPSATSQDYAYKRSIVSAIQELNLPTKIKEYLMYDEELT